MMSVDNNRERQALDLQDRARRTQRVGYMLFAVALLSLMPGLAILRVVAPPENSDIPWILAPVWVMACGGFGAWMLVRAIRLKEKSAAMMADALDVQALLGKRLSLEHYDAAGKADETRMKAVGLAFKWGNCANLFTGTLDGRRLLSCSVELMKDGPNDNSVTLYEGQLSLLEARGRFPGKLVLARPEALRKGRFRASYYGRVDLVSHNFKAFRKKAREALRLVLPDALDGQWEAYTDTPEAAAAMLRQDTALCDQLRRAEKLDFVLYNGGDIVFGGDYAFDLSEGSADEARERCERALDGLFNEAIPAVDSAVFPVQSA